MIPIVASAQEEAVLAILESNSPCSLEDVVRNLPHLGWVEVFVAVERLSKIGLVLIRQVGYSTYQLSLCAQLAVRHSRSDREVAHS